MSQIRGIGERVLKDLIECYYANIPYYLKQNVGGLFNGEEDSLFITNEEILGYVSKVLSEKYILVVTPVVRVFKSEEDEDFEFEDLELRIMLVTDLKF